MRRPRKTIRPALAYRYGDGLYINLTNRCPTACQSCIKTTWRYRYRGYDLRLSRDPSVEAVIKAAGDVSGDREIVFCGYGESTYRLEEMAALADHFRSRGVSRIRLNTVGLGSLIHGRNIAPDLSRIVDSISISLNSADPVQYLELQRPQPRYRARAFSAALDFIRECVKVIPEVTVTAVSRPSVDMSAVERLAERLGARFRERPFLDDYEDDSTRRGRPPKSRR
ncbi:MAG TPA: TatD family nuclease-associated radical SAM protein [Elusimicrobiota bacterium]|nr:TatD family nuclease-associated radical SAM protein [Elusimicrobiota bacterium]